LHFHRFRLGKILFSDKQSGNHGPLRPKSPVISKFSGQMMAGGVVYKTIEEEEGRGY